MNSILYPSCKIIFKLFVSFGVNQPQSLLRSSVKLAPREDASSHVTKVLPYVQVSVTLFLSDSAIRRVVVKVPSPEAFVLLPSSRSNARHVALPQPHLFCVLNPEPVVGTAHAAALVSVREPPPPAPLQYETQLCSVVSVSC